MSRKKKTGLILLLSGLLLWYWLCLPSPLFHDSASTVLEDKNGILLGAKIAGDGQWRFPYNEKVPEKFARAVVRFEDKYFFAHPGINPVSVFRALFRNIKAGKIKSGGSTLTMQVIRLARKNKPRTLFEKLIEVILATRLEISYSKKEILALYASHAPFGGNVVGLDAASWRYFGRNPAQLSWAESATLAVLPNAPSLIYPGKNHEKLLKKRNRLLTALWKAGEMDSITCALAQVEPLPEKPFPLPQLSPHLLDRAAKEGMKGQKILTTLDASLQETVKEIVEKHSLKLQGNQIYNAAAIVAEVETGNVIAYVGNVSSQGTRDKGQGAGDGGQGTREREKVKQGERETDTHALSLSHHPIFTLFFSRPLQDEHGNSVDIIMAPRSTGSILKPFLYCAMLSDGEILANTLVPDVPTQIANFSPKNYYLTYDGAVPAKRALARSLNVPCVKMLQQYGTGRFHYKLKKLGITTLSKPADHYGLSLILGGAEATLWDLCGIYASMARTLRSPSLTLPQGERTAGVWHPLKYFIPATPIPLGGVASPTPARAGTDGFWRGGGLLDVSSIYLTFEAMAEVNRPEMDAGWQLFSSSSKIAWKTGTSFGYRDGWAIGISPQYVVGVWVGNASGEGRPNLTGIGTAAPILFEIFGTLGQFAKGRIRSDEQEWFVQPREEMKQIDVCRQSGCRALPICEQIEKQWVQVMGLKTAPCPYHRTVHLDASGKWRVTSDCEDVSKMLHKSWFVLPPAMEWYYKSKNPGYCELPPFRSDCIGSASASSMELIYPKQESKIFVPVELDESTGKTIFRAAHRKPETIIYWHLDNNYIGCTKDIHQLGISPEPGPHTITLVDEWGETVSQKFEIIGKPVRPPARHRSGGGHPGGKEKK